MAKSVAMLLGIVLTLTGIAGFFVAGNLLWFEVGATHNVIHILSGVIGMYAASKGESAAKVFLILFGLVYGLVAILGFMSMNILGLFTVNAADNYLHTGIAAVCLLVGFSSKPRM